MPVIGGIEATRLIRDSEATRAIERTPIIALTADAMGDIRKYVTNPVWMITCQNRSKLKTCGL